jgi:hypothetical protein
MNNKKAQPILDTLLWAAVILIPIGLFASILLVTLPPPVYALVGNFQIQHFLILILIFGYSLHLGGKIGWLLGLTLTMVLFALPLASIWNSAVSTTKYLGGFIPYKDGFYYYNSAQQLLAGLKIPLNGLQGVFRPLFPGLLSVLLLLTRGNLLCTQAIVVGWTGFCCFCASFQAKKLWGSWPAALFMVLLYLFALTFIGPTLTELPSLAFSCLAFIVLMRAAKTKKIFDLTLGGFLLLIGISIRAGAFLILPVLILWVGWLFRNGNRLAWKPMGLFALIFLVEFVLTNFLFPRLVTVPGASTFGNFSWMLYGQSVGGAGWTYHYKALGTQDAGIVMQAAFDNLIHYPQGMIIGSIKAYRDFFFPGVRNIFNLISGQPLISYILFWVINLGLMIWGLVQTLRKSNYLGYLLITSCVLGTFLSIPFLPPIDGGNRFYSGSILYIFALEAIGLFSILQNFKISKFEPNDSKTENQVWIRGFSVSLILIILIGPLLILTTRSSLKTQSPQCPADQIPFSFYLYKDSYVDITPQSSAPCGKVPNICLEDFKQNGVDKTNDDFYRMLVDWAETNPGGIRLAAVNNLLTSEYYFVVGPINGFSTMKSDKLFSGCAINIHSQFQKVLWMQSSNPS